MIAKIGKTATAFCVEDGATGGRATFYDMGEVNVALGAEVDDGEEVL